jgi:aryl-alcohol dehydrogenase-like predicted oxidoreductase
MGFGTSVDEIDAEEQLSTFLDAGGTLVDTAPIYGDGRTEPLVGGLLGKLGVRDKVVLSGKAGLAFRDGSVVRDASRKNLLDQLDQSLRDLGTDHLDLWQVHRWDEVTPLDETLAALEGSAMSASRISAAGRRRRSRRGSPDGRRLRDWSEIRSSTRWSAVTSRPTSYRPRNITATA